MKYLWLGIVAMSLSSCASISFITLDRGQLVTQDREPVNIVGNPPMDCTYPDSEEVFSGFFMYKTDDGVIVLDAFGQGEWRLKGDVTCRFRHDD